MDSRYLVIDKKILPDVYQKVIEAKELLRTGKVKEVTEAVKKVGISRSTYYKYKDFVFTLSEGSKGKKATLAFLLSHEMGVLSNILNFISESRGNVLTINQDIPINDVANVSITFDISNIKEDIQNMIKDIKQIKGVEKIELIAME